MKVTDPIKPVNWYEAFEYLFHPRVITMVFFGFSAGIPLLLIFSSLSLWLGEAGIEEKAVTFFSWAALGYSFKFVWAPLIDKVPLPYLSKYFGRRRAWLMVSQISIAIAIMLMGSVDPAISEENLSFLALSAVLLGFSAATQDIVIDAYRIESADVRLQAMASSAYVAGYRTGMVVSGAGALFMASWLGSEMGEYQYLAWKWTYYAMAATMVVGLITTLIIDEPEVTRANKYIYATFDYVRLVLVFICTVIGFISFFFFSSDWLDQWHDFFNSVLISFLLETMRLILAIMFSAFIGFILITLHAVNRQMVKETWVEPVEDFFQRYGLKTALILLVLIGLYRISDIIPGVISNLFYQSLGFTKPEIATAVKTFGVFVSIAGGVIGGVVATYLGVMRTLMIGAVLTALTNLVFVWLAFEGHNLMVMYTAVTIDNLAAGFATAAFVAFLSGLTNVSFTAMQYAIFSSLMTLIPKTLGGYSGTMVHNIGYPAFFTMVTLIGIPVLWLVWKAEKQLSQSS